MPKIKTKRAAAKRFSKTGTGKLKRNKAYKSHILTKEDHQEKEKSQKGCDDRRNQHQEHEESFTVYLRLGKEELRDGKN